MTFTRGSSPAVVAVGNRPIDHSRFRCSCGGGGSRNIVSGGAIGRCISLFIGCGLGILTTLSTRVSAATSFGRRFLRCHSRRIHPTVVDSKSIRTRTRGVCRRTGRHIDESNKVIRPTRVLVHLKRGTSTTSRRATQRGTRSVCRTLYGKNSFTKCTEGCSSSRNSTIGNKSVS